MYKYREDRVEAGDVEQDKDQPADERLGHVGEDGVADEDAQQHRHQRNLDSDADAAKQKLVSVFADEAFVKCSGQIRRPRGNPIHGILSSV